MPQVEQSHFPFLSLPTELQLAILTEDLLERRETDDYQDFYLREVRCDPGQDTTEPVLVRQRKAARGPAGQTCKYIAELHDIVARDQALTVIKCGYQYILNDLDGVLSRCQAQINMSRVPRARFEINFRDLPLDVTYDERGQHIDGTISHLESFISNFINLTDIEVIFMLASHGPARYEVTSEAARVYHQTYQLVCKLEIMPTSFRAIAFPKIEKYSIVIAEVCFTDETTFELQDVAVMWSAENQERRCRWSAARSFNEFYLLEFCSRRYGWRFDRDERVYARALGRRNERCRCPGSHGLSATSSTGANGGSVQEGRTFSSGLC